MSCCCNRLLLFSLVMLLLVLLLPFVVVVLSPVVVLVDFDDCNIPVILRYITALLHLVVDFAPFIPSKNIE